MDLKVIEPAGALPVDEPLDAQEALSELYERHFQSVYDFVLRTVRDPDAAADVVQNTFVKAWETLRKGTAPDNVKAWLFTVARNAAIDDIRRRSHFVQSRAGDGGPDEAIYLEVDADRLSDPAAVLEDREMVDLVWQAAKALNPRDYSLLDLHLRQGLTPDELAEHLGARRGSVYMMLSRLKEALEDAVTCLLLVRRGRRECPALDALMSTLQVGDLTKQARKAIRKHIDACDRCRERSRRFIAPPGSSPALRWCPSLQSCGPTSGTASCGSCRPAHVAKRHRPGNRRRGPAQASGACRRRRPMPWPRW